MKEWCKSESRDCEPKLQEKTPEASLNGSVSLQPDSVIFSFFFLIIDILEQRGLLCAAGRRRNTDCAVSPVIRSQTSPLTL